MLNENASVESGKKELVSSKTTKDDFKSAHQNQQQVLILSEIQYYLSQIPPCQCFQADLLLTL